MLGWLQLDDDRRRQTLTQAAQASGITVNALEKDWWVTLVLQALFSCEYSQFMVFKGGTSLSKGWNLIQRLSEDIDIILAPEAFGMAYNPAPGTSELSRLKRRGCNFTSNELRNALQRQLAMLGLPAGTVEIVVDPIDPAQPDKDPQTLFVRYRSLYDPNPYLPAPVKIEVSVRSLGIPFEARPIGTLLNEYFPQALYQEVSFYVRSVLPKKTFIEKMMLMHEEFFQRGGRLIRVERMSRHLYDIACISQSEHADEALADVELYNQLHSYRRNFIKLSGFDYDTLSRDRISFMLPETEIDAYRGDYRVMQTEMIYRNPPITFDTILQQVSTMNERIREN